MSRRSARSVGLNRTQVLILIGLGIGNLCVIILAAWVILSNQMGPTGPTAEGELTATNPGGAQPILPTVTFTQPAQPVLPSATPTQTQVPPDTNWQQFALACNGAGGNVLIDDNNSLDGLTAITVEAWVRTALTAPQAIVSRYRHFTNNLDDSFYLGLDDQARPYLELAAGNTTQRVVAAGQIADGTWHHIAGTWDGQVMTIYVDGRQDAAVPYAPGAPLNNNEGSGFIAQTLENSVPARFFAGELDEVRVWQTARSEVEILGSMFGLLPEKDAQMRAYWNFNLSGTSAYRDLSGNSNGGFQEAGCDVVTSSVPGTLDGLLPVPLPPQSPGNWAGTALLFNGIAFGEVAQARGLDSLNALTVEAWVRPVQGATFQSFVSMFVHFTGNDDDSFYLGSDENGRPYLQVAAGNSFASVVAPARINDGRWHHVAGVWDGALLSIYVDGQLQASQPYADGLNVNTTQQPLFLGVTNEAGQFGRFFAGEMDEIRIWGVARSEGQIRDAMHRRLVGTETGLRSYWQVALDKVLLRDLTTFRNNMELSGIEVLDSTIPNR